MKDDSDGALRKSNRVRVPNSFYTEGINELKRAPRPPRQPQPKQRKKSRVYQEEEDISYEEQPLEEERSEPNRDSGNWYACKLPKNGSTIKVQFVLTPPEQIAPEKKEEPPKPTKKADSSFDLLSLFQKAIENVNDNDKIIAPPANPDYPSKEARLKPAAPLVKPRRGQDTEGRITAVQQMQDKVIFLHSKLGQVEVPVSPTSTEQPEDELVDHQMVEQWRQKIINTNTFAQMTAFN